MYIDNLHGLRREAVPEPNLVFVRVVLLGGNGVCVLSTRAVGGLY